MDDELRGLPGPRPGGHRRAPGRGLRQSARPAHVAALGAIADGVIVASELIRLIGEAPSPAAATEAIEAFAAEAVAALGG